MASETVTTSVPQSGDGTELVSGGTSGSTATHILAWESASDWDAATGSAVEHSSRIDETSVRLASLEDDGEVSEYGLGTVDTSDNQIEPASHGVTTSSVGLGSNARVVQSANSDGQYSRVQFNHSQTVAPDKTELWVNIPKPNNNNWVFNIGFREANGDQVTRIGFDGGSGSWSDNIASLTTTSGWNMRGDYPANTWFKIVFDWDWANNEYDLYVDGTYRGTQGFRGGAASGFVQYYELWDYRNSGLTGYVDHQGAPHASTGTLTTAAKTTPSPLDASTVSLANVSHSVNGQSITAYVESDPNGDGTFEETSDPITLDGSENHSVTGLSSDSDTFRVRFEMTSNNFATPQLSDLELTGEEA